LAEVHDDRFDAITDQALKDALVVTLVFCGLDYRKQHREAAVRAFARR